jgi:serine/threonine-protein kinase
MVMEYVEGRTVADLLQAVPVTLDEAIAWTARILDALACAHDAGLVHRGIKPANVMITASAQVKVMDFGIAHAAGAPIRG